MELTFDATNFRDICDLLASRDTELAEIILQHGYPPMWTRPNTFESLVHIILEQQVSLASALAALRKLQETTDGLTPEHLLVLSDETLRACYVSRQKAGYIRNLAEKLVNKTLNLEAFEHLPEAEVRKQLVALKGIGNWTADIYLMFILRRTDVFPVGDLAAANALKRVKNLPKTASQEILLEAVAHWKPYRSLGTMLLWHHYLSDPVKRVRTAAK